MASMDKIALLELIRKIGLEDGDIDFLREEGARRSGDGCRG
jgi:putative transposase